LVRKDIEDRWANRVSGARPASQVCRAYLEDKALPAYRDAMERTDDPGTPVSRVNLEDRVHLAIRDFLVPLETPAKEALILLD